MVTSNMIKCPYNYIHVSVRLMGYSFVCGRHQNDSKVSLSVTDLRLLYTINHFNKATISRIKILTSLFGHYYQLPVFKVTLNKHNKFTRLGDIGTEIYQYHLVSRYWHVVQGQRDLFVIMFLKMIHPLVLWWIYSPFGMKLHVVCQAEAE